MNIYQVVDNELSRLHALLKKETSAGHSSGAREIAKIISNFHAVMQKALVNNDPQIQEKVAELALMGDSNNGK